MGFAAHEQSPIWLRYRDEFPVARRYVYLNHASVAPLCRPAAAAMTALAADLLEHGALHFEDWLATYDALRASAARLVGARPGEIAIVKNTSEGVSTIANGISWKSGDRVVCFTEEFPANLMPWQQLERFGVVLERLSVEDPLERIEQAARGARLLAVSFVQFLSGRRADLAAIGAICRRAGCFFFVDAIQGLGAFPLDVEAAQIDAFSADGHKWLLGPEGCGILYVRAERQDEVRPVEFGWTNFAGFGDYGGGRAELRADAGRYEPGTLNTIGCYGLRAAIDFLLGVGIPRIAAHVQSLGDRIAEGAQAKGYTLLGNRTPETGAGIVSFRKEGQDSRMVVRKLKDAGVLAAPRQGWIRFAPHFYAGPEDIDGALDLLP